MSHSVSYVKNSIGYAKPSPKFQSTLMDKILDELNKTENAKYQDFFVDWFNTKEKFNPMVGAYKKIKIKEKLHPLEAWWEREALLKKDYLSGRFQKMDILPWLHL